jgi:hypothetical protein
MEGELFHANGQNDVTKLTVGFRNIANAPKIIYVIFRSRQRCLQAYSTLTSSS